MKKKFLKGTFMIVLLLPTVFFLGCVSAQQRAARAFDYGMPPPDNYKQLIMDEAKTNCPKSPLGLFNYAYSKPYKHHTGNDHTSGWAVDIYVTSSVSFGGASSSYSGQERVVFHNGQIVYWSRFFTCKD